MRRHPLASGLLILAAGLLAAGCGGSTKTYELQLIFPSTEEINRTDTVEIFAIDPGSDGNCDDLMVAGSDTWDVVESWAEAEVLDQAFMDGPNPAELPELVGLGKGTTLFFARVKDGNVIFLRGCRSVEVGDVEDISIELELF
jgi:hypothetical protein